MPLRAPSGQATPTPSEGERRGRKSAEQRATRARKRAEKKAARRQQRRERAEQKNRSENAPHEDKPAPVRVASKGKEPNQAVQAAAPARAVQKAAQRGSENKLRPLAGFALFVIGVGLFFWFLSRPQP